jgi:hypothetical protein
VRRCLHVTLWLIVGTTVLLIVTGGFEIYDSRQYGYAFRGLTSSGEAQIQCYIQPTHSSRRYGPVLYEGVGETYYLVIKAYDAKSGHPLAIACADVKLTTPTSKVEFEPSEISPYLSGQEIRVPLSLSFDMDSWVECEATVTLGDDTSQAGEIVMGRAHRQPSVTRVWPYWWARLRRSWAG